MIDRDSHADEHQTVRKTGEDHRGPLQRLGPVIDSSSPGRFLAHISLGVGVGWAVAIRGNVPGATLDTDAVGGDWRNNGDDSLHQHLWVG